ncbi:BA75_01159T0 [Komagataella pastoris]|uniref:BA75_01159T0 n=1 Tax=Komagataella pastoris TaxID=4922 RepID=A0A1B2J5I2_PICPA|nr:BA75_01159T0 [Komagataella pastoris]
MKIQGRHLSGTLSVRNNIRSILDDWVSYSSTKDSKEPTFGEKLKEVSLDKSKEDTEIDGLVDNILEMHLKTAKVQQLNQTSGPSLQERNVFSQIFESLHQKNKTQPLNSTTILKRGRKTFKPKSLHALFQENETTNGDNKVSLTDKDIRDFPLSLTSNYFQKSVDTQGNASKSVKFFKEQEKTRKELFEKLDPTLRHINSLTTDVEVYRYALKITDKYLKQSKSNKHSSRKSFSLEEVAVQSSKTPELPLLTPTVIQALVLHCVMSLIVDFNSYDYAINIFEKIKAWDINLYMVTCTNDFYNVILKQTWLRTQDLDPVLALLQEMKTNGVNGNLRTLEILAQIKLYFVQRRLSNIQVDNAADISNNSTEKSMLKTIDRELKRLVKQYLEEKY